MALFGILIFEHPSVLVNVKSSSASIDTWIVTEKKKHYFSLLNVFQQFRLIFMVFKDVHANFYSGVCFSGVPFLETSYEQNFCMFSLATAKPIFLSITTTISAIYWIIFNRLSFYLIKLRLFLCIHPLSRLKIVVDVGHVQSLLTYPP